MRSWSAAVDLTRGHGLERVDREVENDLLQLRAVAGDGLEARRRDPASTTKVQYRVVGSVFQFS